MAKKSIFCHKIGNFAQDLWQLATFGIGEFRQHKIHVAEALAEIIVGGAEAQAWKIVSAKVRNGRFETIIATCAAPFAVANFAEFQIEIIADD